MDIILCDGNYERNQSCKNEATFLARSNLDPLSCIYYCCEDHKESYKRQGFIIENIKKYSLEQ